MIKRYLIFFAIILISFSASTQTTSTQIDELRPMTFLDMRKMKRAGSYDTSVDGQWLLYTVTTPNWETAEEQSDIHLVSLTEGLSSNRQMTFTGEKSENSPTWSRSGKFFVFSSNRDGDKNQLYMMNPDGGEARKFTKEKEGVSTFQFSKDGLWLAYKSGKTGKEQLYILAAENLHSSEPEKITKLDVGVNRWEWSPDSKRIYFTCPNEYDEDNNTRKDEGFTVDVKNYETPLESLWYLDLEKKESTRITKDSTYTVSRFVISDDSKWVGYTGTSAGRYERNITEQRLNADLFLYDTQNSRIERLTDNHEVSESGPYFSPDSKLVAFVASEDMSGYNMRSRRVYIRNIEARGASFKKLGSDFNDHVGVNFWSDDSKTIYFSGGIRVTRQLMSLNVESGVVQQLTDEKAVLSVSKDKDSGEYMVNYTDPKTQRTMFAVPDLDRITDRTSWVQITNLNSEVKGFSLGEQREINYRSTDGKVVGGVLILPVGYEEGKRYPLLVSIHGGPAGADYLSFNEGSGGQVYAGAGYAMFCPNYRGSTNYGEQHRIDIVGNYFPQAFDDIMAGVDYLIAEGIVDGDKMGVFGWSAGGHWSNWILTHTDRFKAISSGAGTMNWISMYAQSDVQRNRQYYLGNDLPYDNFDAYWEQSPLKYIKNAKTPTMVHVVAGDPRVPSPQSVELHMALKKLGVDTELFMYPGKSHGIPGTRNRLVKSMSEKAWFDYYLLGKGQKFSWRHVLETLKSKNEKKEESEESAGTN